MTRRAPRSTEPPRVPEHVDDAWLDRWADASVEREGAEPGDVLATLRSWTNGKGLWTAAREVRDASGAQFSACLDALRAWAPRRLERVSRSVEVSRGA